MLKPEEKAEVEQYIDGSAQMTKSKVLAIVGDDRCTRIILDEFVRISAAFCNLGQVRSVVAAVRALAIVVEDSETCMATLPHSDKILSSFRGGASVPAEPIKQEKKETDKTCN